MSLYREAWQTDERDRSVERRASGDDTQTLWSGGHGGASAGRRRRDSLIVDLDAI